MIIGVPKELKEYEGRVGLDPAGARLLVQNGHMILVQDDAGRLSGFSDIDYSQAGAMVCSEEEVWETPELVVKVKEPQRYEWRLFRKGLKIMTFFHFPANPELKKECERAGVVAIPYESIRSPGGFKPILRAMSEVAGEVAADMASQYLRSASGGKGILMSDATVSIIGVWGNVGQKAYYLLRPRVKKIFGLDKVKKPDHLTSIGMIFEISTQKSITDAISKSDVVIGAAANRDGGAPHLIMRDMVKKMEPGSVIIDVAIDEGGISETSYPTTYANPSYVEERVVHVCIANLPGGVPRTSTPRLVTVSLPYILRVAKGENVL